MQDTILVVLAFLCLEILILAAKKLIQAVLIPPPVLHEELGEWPEEEHMEV